MIITRTPYRISFFGGGTDLNDWFNKNGGAVISTSIDKYCYISCRFLPKFFEHNHRFVYSKIETVKDVKDIEHPAIRGVLSYMNWTRGIEFHHDGDLPARSGLGSSSSFTVGMLNALSALNGDSLTREELARQAIYVEQKVLKENVGMQDQVAAAVGGFNRIDFFDQDSFKVSPLSVPNERLHILENSLLLFYTGISRFASHIEKSKMDNLNSRSFELKKIYEMVELGTSILIDKKYNLDDFGLLLNEGWNYKKSLSNLVTNPEIDGIYNRAIRSGAFGGKLLGAGGGGFFLFYAPQQAHDAIIKELSDLVHVPFKFENSGSTVTYRDSLT